MFVIRTFRLEGSRPCEPENSAGAELGAAFRQGQGPELVERASLRPYKLPATYAATPQHFLYFLPLPHGQGSLRPTLGPSRFTVVPGSLSWPV